MNVVKRRGHMEKFDERKVYASIYAAALTAGYGEVKSENLADKICKVVKKTFGKRTINTIRIKNTVINNLQKNDKDVAFLYETHLDIS